VRRSVCVQIGIVSVHITRIFFSPFAFLLLVQIIETICYSRRTDAFLKEKFAKTDAFWEDKGVYSPPTMYYGALDGAFRIFPARQSEYCGVYDPRSRPWFRASVPWLLSNSTGGRDVMLIVDNSKSVGEDKKKKAMFQNASKIFIESLTEQDRIALVQFNGDAQIAGGYTALVQATKKTQEVLIKAIDEMKPIGRTNYEIAFKTGFDLLKNSSSLEDETNCNTALIFITDNEANYPAGTSAAKVIALVEEEMASFSRADSTQIFTYSANNNEQMKAISCGTDAIWMGMTNATVANDLIEPYFSFFSIGLGDNPANENFTAWVGPYQFATGKVTGITSSAMVYDRTMNPAQFIGAVGADMKMEKIEEILGVTGEEAKLAVQGAMKELRQTPNITCPVQLEGCGLEAARYWTGGHASMCEMSCQNDTSAMPQECSGKDEYPDNLWNNTKLEGEPYQERTCCKIGESEPSKECPDLDIYGVPKLSKMEIFGIICGLIVFFELVACVYWQSGFSFLECFKCRRKRSASRV